MRLQSADLGRSGCSGLLVTVTYLLDDSQNQRRAQTLHHSRHSDLLEAVRCHARIRSVEGNEATPEQRYPKSQTESR